MPHKAISDTNEVQTGLTDEMITHIGANMMLHCRIALRSFVYLKENPLFVHSVAPLAREIENQLYRNLKKLVRLNNQSKPQ